MIDLFRSFKTEVNENSNTIILRSQVLGYRVLVALLLVNYLYKFFFHNELSQDILFVYFISLAVTLRYQAKNKVFPLKWNDIIVLFSVAGIVIFAILLVVFFYQYK